MCGSMVDIQSATAEIRRGNEKRKIEEEETTGQNIMDCSFAQGGHKHSKCIAKLLCETLTSEKETTLECGPMPNVMVALPNIGGALCSTPQSLADAHY